MPTLKTDYATGDVFTPGSTGGTTGINATNDLANHVNQALFGNGADGALSITSGTTNVALNQVVQYTSFTMTGGTLSTASTGGQPLVIKVLGDFSMTGSSTIDFNAKGFRGGDGGASGSVQNGSTLGVQFGDSGKHGGDGNGGGGGGHVTAGTDGAGGGGATGGVAQSTYYANDITWQYGHHWCGAGGAGGGSATDGTPSGGRGGGCVIIYVAGNVTIGASAVIRANGGAGVAGASGTTGGGGGGAGGTIVIYYGGTLSNAGTVTVTAGAGGAGTGGGTNGGAGGSGYSSIISATIGFLFNQA